jgi:Tol biopolymer transport system component
LAGTELQPSGGPFNFPFWSPDSRFVVFAANGKLKKVDITGGPPQTICDFPENSALTGGSWSRDGVILFGIGQTTGGVMRVAASGGTASWLVKNDAARGVTGQDFPLLLPDGSHFIYYKHNVKSETAGIYIGSLESKPEAQEPKRILATESGAAVVPSQNSEGHYILFIRENIILAQRFDARRLEVTGEPLPIAYQAGTNLNPWFSASNNGVLIYRGGLGTGVGEKLQPTWFDRKGKDTSLSLQRDSYGFLSTMSDGKRLLATISDPAKFVSNLWVFDLTRGVSNRITTNALGFLATPVWSPDGLQVVYGSNHGAGPYDLYQKAANGTGDERLLYKSDSSKFPTSWSRDGRYVLYQSDVPPGKPDFWVLPMEGERKPTLFLRAESSNQRRGQFSPDGNFVAYESDENGKFEVYVRAFPDPTKGKWPVSNGGGTGPRWRSDGKELFYLAPDQAVMAVEVSTSPIFQVGARHALFKLSPQVVNFDVTGDGNKFLAAVPADTDNSAATPFNVVLNWQVALKK